MCKIKKRSQGMERRRVKISTMLNKNEQNKNKIRTNKGKIGKES